MVFVIYLTTQKHNHDMPKGGIRSTSNSKHRSCEWLQTKIGEKRKGKLINYSLNTGKNLTEWVRMAIAKLEKEDPVLYATPIDIGTLIKQQATIEDKIQIIMIRQRSAVSIRFITSMLNKYDRRQDRKTLRITVQTHIADKRFYEMKPMGKHAVYGLTSWLEDKK